MSCFWQLFKKVVLYKKEKKLEGTYNGSSADSSMKRLLPQSEHFASALTFLCHEQVKIGRTKSRSFSPQDSRHLSSQETTAGLLCKNDSMFASKRRNAFPCRDIALKMGTQSS